MASKPANIYNNNNVICTSYFLMNQIENAQDSCLQCENIRQHIYKWANLLEQRTFH